MPLHQRPDLTQRVRKWLGIRGAEAFDTVAPEIVPVVSVGDLIPPSSETYLARAARAIQVPAGAGAYGFVLLWNPASSGKVVEVESAHFCSDANQQVDFRVVSATAGSAVATEWCDQRLSGAPTALLYRGSSASPPSGNSLIEGRILAETTLYFDNLGYILGEGQGFAVVASVVNQIVNGGVTWRERDKFSGE